MDAEVSYFEVLNAFAKRLIEAKNTEEAFDFVISEAIEKLGYKDFVIYLYRKRENALVQAKVFQKKISPNESLKEPLVLKPGEGIVGYVFSSGVGEIIPNTSLDERYVADLSNQKSEITIPIIIGEEVIGVIDSEHEKEGYYTQKDFYILSTIANMLSVKISTIQKEENAKNKLNEALKIKSDAVIKLNSLILQQEDEKKVLIKEVHHRVKNNLQIIISLLKMQIEEADSEHEKKVFDACINRLYSFANIHGKLYFQNNILNISIEDFIYELGSYLIVSHYQSKVIDLNLDIQVNKVPLDVGIPLGLLINELISQSISHGFEGDLKAINIGLIKQSNQVLLRYSDTGNGFNSDILQHKSLSLKLVQIFIEQLDAKLEIHRSQSTKLSVLFNPNQT